MPEIKRKDTKMKTKKKNFIRTMAATLAAVIAMSPIVANAKLRAWGTPIGDGTIHMTHNSKCAELYHSGNPEGTSNCNAKAVVKDGNWIPVYCVEKGKYLNDTDYVTAEMYSNDEWNSTYGMSVRDAIGMIYVCGYNGQNGWGEIQAAIFDHDADDDTLMANSNYHKYVATQAVIWEVVTGNTYYSRNSSVQGAIDTLRSRIKNYQNRESLAASKSGNISVYTSSSDAQANPYKQTSVENNGIAHFAYGYDFYTPSNRTKVTGPALNCSSSDFTIADQDEMVTFEWTRVYGSSASAGQAGEPIYTLDSNNAENRWGVVLWRPGNGNQLTISATATSQKVYASFNFHVDQAMYTADATLNTTKVDDQGNPSRGATFTIYKADGSSLGTMTDAKNDGHYSFSLSSTEFADVGKFYYDKDENGNAITTPISRNYTVKETSPATEVYVNDTWKKATFDSNNATYSISISIDRTSGTMTWTATGTNGGSASRSGSNTSGSISFGSAAQNGKTVNYQLVHANADFTIKKVDELGLEAKGATFGVYTDAACTKASSVTLSDSDGDGIFESSKITWGNRQKASGVQTEVLYIKEKTAATKVKINGKWVDATCQLDTSVKTVRIVWNPADGSIYAELYDGAVTDFKNVTPKLTKAGTTDGTTSSVHADLTSAPWVNVPYVYAKGDITIKKVDNQGRQARGAEFTIYSDEDCTDKVDVMTDMTNDGTYSFDNIVFAQQLRNVESEQMLVYYIKETKAADEIFYNDEWIGIDCNPDESVRKFTVSWIPKTGAIEATMEQDDKEPVTIQGSYDETILTSSVHADFSSEPIVNVIGSTGSMRIEKFDDETHERLTGATFRVYNDVDGNEKYDPEVDTVYCEALKDADGDGVYLLEGIPLDKSYLVVEKEAPEFYETDPNYYSFTLTPSSRNVTIDNVKWKVVEGVPGEFLNHNPIIGTSLTDTETKEHVTTVQESITLVDTVEYKGLHVGEEYLMSGTLYDKETGEPIKDENGNPIIGSVTFVPEASEDTVEVLFEINTEVLRNKTIVASETVYHSGSDRAVGIHFNLNDEEQTVYVPDLHTTLTDSTTKEHIVADGDVELIDVVAFENLISEKEYTVVGKLMDKETGEALKDAEGNDVTSSVTFIPESACGQIEVVFTFPRQTVHGSALVAFEDLYYQDVLLVTHADLEDVEQTVYFPNIGTSASVEGKKEFYPEDKIELVDTVSYENLIPGELYEVSGSLKNADGSDFTVNGQPIVCVLRFVPESASGTVEVKFHFDASSLKTGDKLVVFEKMYLIMPAIGENGEQVDHSILIASHEDLNDEGQTVVVTEKPKVPKTGETDSTGNILIGLIAICVGGAIAFVVIKKKNDD